jgi:hypothetical protein
MGLGKKSRSDLTLHFPRLNDAWLLDAHRAISGETSMTALQSKLFELARMNAELYQLHSRLTRESAAAAAPDHIDRLRTSIRALEVSLDGLMVEIEQLRAADLG